MPELENQLPGGTGQYYQFQAGKGFYKVFYVEAGSPDKPALVMVHGVGGGASSYEWSDNFAVLADHFHVFAYDVLGFGKSERPDIAYSAQFYEELLTDFLEQVVKKPAHLLAASVSAGQAIQVAYRRPELVKKLVLIQPAGANELTGSAGPNITGRKSYNLLRSTVLGDLLFTLVASRFNIRTFLEGQLFYDKKRISLEMLRQYYTAAHQKGARFAPLAFFSARLNSEIGAAFGKVSQPVLLVWGKQARITPLKEAAKLRAQNPAASLAVLDNARLGCNKEQAGEFNELTRAFLEKDK